MSALAALPEQDYLLTGDVLAHLDAQLLSARRLLGVVMEQGAAIRARDVDTVVRQAGRLQAELQHRQLLEGERSRLLERAGARLGLLPAGVTLPALCSLMDPASVQEALTRSAELQGLLAQLQREHAINRALLSQELAFLDHLMRLVDGDADLYGAGGARSASGVSAIAPRRVLDLEA